MSKNISVKLQVRINIYNDLKEMYNQNIERLIKELFKNNVDKREQNKIKKDIERIMLDISDLKKVILNLEQKLFDLIEE